MERSAQTRQPTDTETRTIEFFGPPSRMVAVGDLPVFPESPRITGELEAFLPSGRQSLRLRQAGRRGAARVYLRLHPGTPPGDHEGEIVAGDETWPIIAHVAPDARVAVLTGELAFSGPVGGKATASLAIANDGNTEITVPQAIPIGLFDDDGLEAAFAASYAKPVKGVDGFFEVFHGKLREAHSGLQKLSITRGFGKHGPGTSFIADFALEIKPPMRPGRRYHGVASTDFGDFSVSVSVTNGAAK